MLNSPRKEMPLSLASFHFLIHFTQHNPIKWAALSKRPDAFSQAEALGDVLLLSLVR